MRKSRKKRIKLPSVVYKGGISLPEKEKQRLEGCSIPMPFIKKALENMDLHQAGLVHARSTQ